MKMREVNVVVTFLLASSVLLGCSEAFTTPLGWRGGVLGAHGSHNVIDGTAAVAATRHAFGSRTGCHGRSHIRTLPHDAIRVRRGVGVEGEEEKAGKRQTSSSDHHPGGGAVSRRRILSTTSLVVPSLLLGLSLEVVTHPTDASASLVPASEGKQTIVITGCNSGIGFNAAKRMAKRGHKVIMACRSLEKAKEAVSEITNSLEEVGGTNVDLIPEECDLTSLESVAKFADKLRSDLGGGGQVDVLCLNAGIARNTAAQDILRTKEGFELTVGTNHLGHFYLTQLLLPMVKHNSGRIVITASGVHDPDSPGGAQGSKATLGDLSGLENGPEFEMVDGGSYDPDKAYKDSKLCNVFFTRGLQRRLSESGSGVVANCFSPGLIVGTGLFRDQNPVFTKVFDIAATKVFKVGESVDWGGGALEFMALDKTVGSKGGLYYNSPPGTGKLGEEAYGNQFTVEEVSLEARDDAKAKRLWKLSEKLINDAAPRDHVSEVREKIANLSA